MVPATGVQTVRRENGWPSPELDFFRIVDYLHGFFPVGFYYKIGARPRWLWPTVEPFVRRAAGRGRVDPSAVPVDRERRNLRPDVLVVGGGVAGLSAALTAAERGMSVVLCDEGEIGTRTPPGPYRTRIETLRDAVLGTDLIELLQSAPAVGIYEGPLVVVNDREFLHVIHPSSVVVATGAHETHEVFPGCDLPGVWLGRAAAQMTAVHGERPGRTAVVLGAHHEVAHQIEILITAGIEVHAVGEAQVRRAVGRRAVRGVILVDGRNIPCDMLVIARAFAPRNSLLRQADGLPVVGAGQVVLPNCSLEEAEESGRGAAVGEEVAEITPPLPEPASAGFVCLCEDVQVGDLKRSWAEGFQSTEILKRYTTATMGPCRGAMCHAHLRSFVAARVGPQEQRAKPTTARPPARDITIEQVAAGERSEHHQQTSLHSRHLEIGATMEPAGTWQRPKTYSDVLDEYWAVRNDVSVMDVGTLGKFHVGGRDALEFLERLYPCNVHDLTPGRIRYALLLAEHGYVIDDGVICALEGGAYYVTLTTGGAAHGEAHLRDWAATWDLDVHIVNRTAAVGAINVAGPRARDLLQRLAKESVDREALPYLRHREIAVGGVPCRALRLGFVGELSYELHHPSSRSVELWDALLKAGADIGVKPHGMDTLRLLRLEKGHIIIGQDTDFDATPEKLGMAWAVRLEKPYFVGRSALLRMQERPPSSRLVALRFPAGAPAEGAPITDGESVVGYLTSSQLSPTLGHGVALGWLRTATAHLPSVLEAGGMRGVVTDESFYDPEGNRTRA